MGYNDGSFRPGQEVLKAEFFKILFNGEKIDLSDLKSANTFDDVPAGVWYESLAIKAKELGLIDANEKLFKAETPVKRGEVCDYVYKMLE